MSLTDEIETIPLCNMHVRSVPEGYEIVAGPHWRFCRKSVVAEVTMTGSFGAVHYELCQAHAQDLESAGVEIWWKLR